MATITLSDKAPEGQKLFSLANAEIEVPFETNDAEILSNAVAHPWLKVERDVDVDDYVEAPRVIFDADLRSNSLANDPEAVAAERERREVEYAAPTAIDAGLDQGEVAYVGDENHQVAVTAAADDQAEEVPAEAPVKDEPVAVEPVKTPPAPSDKDNGGN